MRKRLVLLLGALVWVAGCSDRAAPVSPTGKRIVSFSPAMTRIAVDLGARDEIAGVIIYDPLAESVANVGDLYRYDYEKLLAIDPTVVLIQPPADGVPRKLTELAEANGWAVHTQKIERVADVFEAIDFVGKAIARPHAAGELRAGVEQKLDGIGKLASTRTPPRTLVLVGTGPITAAGPGTFIDDLLQVAGGQNVLTNADHRYPVLDREAIVALMPEVVIAIDGSPADPAGGAPAAMPAALRGLDIPAVRDGRVVWLLHRHALLPSSTMPQTAAAMARLLHPDLRERVNGIMAEP